MVGFANMHISVPQEGEGSKTTNEEIRDPLFTSCLLRNSRE